MLKLRHFTVYPGKTPMVLIFLLTSRTNSKGVRPATSLLGCRPTRPYSPEGRQRAFRDAVGYRDSRSGKHTGRNVMNKIDMAQRFVIDAISFIDCFSAPSLNFFSAIVIG